MRILIADDDLTSRLMLVSVVEKCGHQVAVTANGREAWEMLRQPDAPKLVILDWIMPEMDGLEVCRRLRAPETDNPPYVIILTGRRGSDDIIAGLRAGADDYLAKPCQLAELRARVEIGRRTVALREKLNLRVRELQEAIAHTRILQGLLPICSFCKKIRNSKGGWQQLEEYIHTHSEADFSHGICPGCMKKHYPEIAEDDQDHHDRS